MSISPRAVDLACRAADRALPVTPRSIPKRANRLLRALLAPEIERAAIAGQDGTALDVGANAARITTEIVCRWRHLGVYQRREVSRVIADAIKQAYQIGLDERLSQRTSAENGGAA